MKIEEYRSRNNFKTPERYFDNLDNRILEATVKTSVAPARKRTIGLWAKTLGYAATIAILLLLGANVTGSLITGGTAEENRSMAMEENSNEPIDNEFIDNMLSSYPIDDYTFYCFITDTNFD